MRLHDLDDARLKDIRDRGGIEVDGLFQGFAAIEMATPELAPAVDGADIIVVCTGSNAHAEVARLLAPRLRDGQTILLVQGGTGGSLVVRNALGRHGCAADVDVCEMDNYPFSLAWPRPTSMSFTIRKEWLQIAALPAARGEAVVAKLRAAFPQAVAAPNTLYTGLNNANGILHVANMVSNIGRLESAGNGYRFYADGYTPSAIAVLQHVCAERLAVARALGVTPAGHPRVAPRDVPARRRHPRRDVPPPHLRADRPIPVDADAPVDEPQVRHRGRAVRPRPHVRPR